MQGNFKERVGRSAGAWIGGYFRRVGKIDCGVKITGLRGVNSGQGEKRGIG